MNDPATENNNNHSTDAVNDTGTMTEQKWNIIGATVGVLLLCFVVSTYLTDQLNPQQVQSVLNAPNSSPEALSAAVHAKQSIELLSTVNVALALSALALVLVGLIKQIPEKSFIDFMALPYKEERITFPIVSTFFGEQSFAAFIIATVVKISPLVYQNGESLGLGAFVTTSVVLVLLFSIMSLMRFLMVVANISKSTSTFFFIATPFAAIMFGILQIGFKLS